MIALIPVAAAAPLPDAGSLVLALAAASAGAILSRIHRRIVLPVVVLEIVLGILIGPEGLGPQPSRRDIAADWNHSVGGRA